MRFQIGEGGMATANGDHQVFVLLYSLNLGWITSTIMIMCKKRRLQFLAFFSRSLVPRVKTNTQ